MQRRRVGAAGQDRGVADVITFQPSPAPERSLEPALGARYAITREAGQLANDIGESAGGGVAGVLEPAYLPFVLHQSQFVDHLAEPGLARAGKQRVDTGVEAGQGDSIPIAPGLQVVRQLR